jgi:tellurite methyltransferase
VNDRIAMWDARYASGEDLHGWAPSPLLAEALEDLPPGSALDLACGAGRHALFLADRGWRVEAVDGSAVGLALLREEARKRGLSRRLRVRTADLEARPTVYVPRPGAYDLVCNFYYLDRSQWEGLRDAVRPGGLLVAAIHVALPSEPVTGNPDFLLQPGELRARVESWGWQIVHYAEGPNREGGHRHATAELVARRPRPAAKYSVDGRAAPEL